MRVMLPVAGVARGRGEGLAECLRRPVHPAAAALDSVNANIFVADLDLKLVFANAKALDTLRGMAPAIRATFGLSLTELAGASIHRFHHDPARIDRILSDPAALPREA